MKCKHTFNNNDADAIAMYVDLLHQGACPYRVSFHRERYRTLATFHVVKADTTNDEHWNRITESQC